MFSTDHSEIYSCSEMAKNLILNSQLQEIRLSTGTLYGSMTDSNTHRKYC